jgi:hypothetical protein
MKRAVIWIMDHFCKDIIVGDSQQGVHADAGKSPKVFSTPLHGNVVTAPMEVNVAIIVVVRVVWVATILVNQ